MKRSANLKLTLWILFGLIFGALVGQFLYDPQFDPGDPNAIHRHADILFYLKYVGKNLFMGLLKMLILPLIISSVIVSVNSVGDFRSLGKIGGKTFLYYFATMFLAVSVGLLLVDFIQPGKGVNLDLKNQAEQTYALNSEKQARIESGPKGLIPAFLRLIDQMIPSNPFAAAADPSIAALPIIFFSLFFGIVLTTIGEKGKIVVKFFEAVFDVMMKMVHLVIRLAPIGVFCLLAWTVARIGIGVFVSSIGLYMVTVLVGLAIHGLITLPLLLWAFGRTNPFAFLHQMRSALLTAFGTASSSATLPVTIEAATKEGGCSKKAAGFVLPLGTTVNMDGTALYEAVAVAFLAQAYGLQLGWDTQIIIALTATLAAMGAAGIPEAGLVTMVIVISAVNQNILAADPTQAALPVAAVGLILGVDRLIDMCRTTVNTWGDAVGAKIISKSEQTKEDTELIARNGLAPSQA